jgi:hypothetical protein
MSRPAARRLGEPAESAPAPDTQEASMPQYMLLIYGDPSQGPQQGTPEWDAQMGEWFAYTESLQKAGVYVAGEALESPSTATTVAVREGERVVTDGPFADTKEWLGGFYIIDAADLDAALDHAARMPNITYASVEVRPIMKFD